MMENFIFDAKLKSPPTKIYGLFFRDSNQVDLYVLHESGNARRLRFELDVEGNKGDIEVGIFKVGSDEEFNSLMKVIIETEYQRHGKHKVLSYSIPTPSDKSLNEVMSAFKEAAKEGFFNNLEDIKDVDTDERE